MLYKREILADILTHLSQKEITLLTGARQTGKTTILRQVEANLADRAPVFFLNLENLEFVKLLNQAPENIFRIFPLNKKSQIKQYLFIDEIQYLENPTNFLKYIYDEYLNVIKLVVSGSSAFYMDSKFKDSLAGRKKIFYLLSLGLRDFLIFRGRADILEYIPKVFSLDNLRFSKKFPIIFKKDLEILVEELMIYGGYPRVVLAEEKSAKISILEELATSYIKKDVFESGLKDAEKYYDLFKILSSQLGGQINTNELANTLNLSRPTVDNYLFVMRKSFHFAMVKPFTSNIRREISKMPKGYFYDTGLRNYFINNFNPLNSRQDPGQLLENFIFKQFMDKIRLDDIHYWRTITGDEVDFVIKDEIAFEVKYRSLGFTKGQYTSFTKNYPSIPLFLMCHISSEANDKAWESWMI